MSVRDARSRAEHLVLAERSMSRQVDRSSVETSLRGRPIARCARRQTTLSRSTPSPSSSTMLDGWATTQPCGDFPAARAATGDFRNGFHAHTRGIGFRKAVVDTRVGNPMKSGGDAYRRSRLESRGTEQDRYMLSGASTGWTCLESGTRPRRSRDRSNGACAATEAPSSTQPPDAGLDTDCSKRLGSGPATDCRARDRRFRRPTITEVPHAEGRTGDGSVVTGRVSCLRRETLRLVDVDALK